MFFKDKSEIFHDIFTFEMSENEQKRVMKILLGRWLSFLYFSNKLSLTTFEFYTLVCFSGSIANFISNTNTIDRNYWQIADNLSWSLNCKNCSDIMKLKCSLTTRNAWSVNGVKYWIIVLVNDGNMEWFSSHQKMVCGLKPVCLCHYYM